MVCWKLIPNTGEMNLFLLTSVTLIIYGTCFLLVRIADCEAQLQSLYSGRTFNGQPEQQREIIVDQRQQYKNQE